MAAFLVAVCKITNPNENLKKYIAASEELLVKHGGQYVARGPAETIFEGDYLNGKVIVISKWPDLHTLKGFVQSDEYQKEIAPLRADTGIYDIGCLEGL